MQRALPCKSRLLWAIVLISAANLTDGVVPCGWISISNTAVSPGQKPALATRCKWVPSRRMGRESAVDGEDDPCPCTRAAAVSKPGQNPTGAMPPNCQTTMMTLSSTTSGGMAIPATNFGLRRDRTDTKTSRDELRRLKPVARLWSPIGADGISTFTGSEAEIEEASPKSSLVLSTGTPLRYSSKSTSQPRATARCACRRSPSRCMRTCVCPPR